MTLGYRVSSPLNAGLKRRRREQTTLDRPYYILLADDQVGFRRGVRKTLEEIPGVKVAGAAGNRRVRFDLRAWLVSSGLGVGTFA